MSLLTSAQQIKNETTEGANTALRVGGLLEDIVTPHDGRASYGNGNSYAIELVQDTPVKLTNFTLTRNNDTSLVSNAIVIATSGRYLVNGMVSFTGFNGGIFNLEIRKNDVNICECNPKVQTNTNRITNLTSIDIDDFETGDTISIWIENIGTTGTITVHSQKILVTNI